jgi:hypothetical protein
MTRRIMNPFRPRVNRSVATFFHDVTVAERLGGHKQYANDRVEVRPRGGLFCPQVA